jgi:hypothetical protein
MLSEAHGDWSLAKAADSMGGASFGPTLFLTASIASGIVLAPA